MATKTKKTAVSKRITAAKAKAIKGAKGRATKKAAKAKNGKPAAKAGAPKAGTKGAQLLAMLGKGATSVELCKALGWQPHTLRAAISRVQGKVNRTRVDGVTSYRIGG
jgi:hypothetical protein